MLDMMRALVAHKGHADAALLNAVRQNAGAAGDPEILELLHHVLLANRFWLLTILREPFVIDVESQPALSLGVLIERYRGTHTEELAWLARAADADLERLLENELIPGQRCTVAEALTQVCLHSHGHRAQCAKLLRRYGGVPPRMDFILWLTGRPAAEWDAESVS
jgi:uncharacterized damage-inducible protein DinB